MFKLNRAVVEWFNKIFTDAYKLVGFLILAVILIGLISYFVLNIFYMTSTRWVAPVILSASHERVIRLNGELTQQINNHDRLVSERSEIKAEKVYIERALQAQEAFRQQLRAAMKSELDGRKGELRQVQMLMGDYQKSGKESEDTLKDFKDLNVEQLTSEYEANLIDRQAFVDGTFSLSQMENARLSRQARKLQVAARGAQLTREVAALEEALKNPEELSLPDDSATRLTFEVVSMLREYRNSALEAGRLRADGETVSERIAMLDKSIERYQRLQNEIENSPYLRAMNEQVAIAFVPYDNLSDAEVGRKVYGCSLGLVWCREVGSVERVLDGEVTADHPLYSERVRGRMVELELKDPTWAQKKALFTGRAPLLI